MISSFMDRTVVDKAVRDKITMEKIVMNKTVMGRIAKVTPAQPPVHPGGGAAA